MGGSETVGVRTGELGALGSDYRRSADAVRDQAKRIADHPFGIGDEAGRNYAPQGIAVRQGLERISAWLRTWSTATTATADALGAAVVAYAETDQQRADETNKT
ncbi:type VII secretion target [Nocardia barduliensis]|uniref:type VII secretion target n=1 Tax=Nocardia barduliensis TaxID=2736643 RepID=UPI001574270D|nr:type VII secretion target [Nocardia barduliensis]